ncbi:HlyD family secretion protein [Dolichospermum sp. ST_con]|nr:HlyD family secretion protein [Dolichospermum sp. ST_con]MDD1419838.1 HlyD family secretion protein [Dolichospermum sp. ST_sed1]MDD1426573.1 HlyD family secretion protein [Dolichospermum sp. ST_sed9]MDD1433093.1 HlyD family secretion protein [Dolichospermum sp. ST_sed6]MDD1435708.1 HlyD family secretion protein [Dolichospermum sp. ST_sed10]MDD1441335.1 HlyD family secretion protein [Dolichospermum sp. ST_sed3]MDD1445925.1 HlyD family secretion protein [Dolichospermum sp. ST_sed8]MDD145659
MLYTHNQELNSIIENDNSLPPISIWTSLVGVFLMMTVITSISLSSWVKYNVTVKAAAIIRPIGETRVVQSKIEGTVKSIEVKDNQVVKEGDIIALLDTESLLIKKSQLEENIQQSKLQIFQIYVQNRTLNNQIMAEKRVVERIIITAKEDLLKAQREYEERKINTESELMTAEVNIQKELVDFKKAQADLEFAKVDRDRYENLSKIGAIGNREFEQKKLVVQQTTLTLESAKKAVNIARIKIKSNQAAINPTTAMVKMAEERIAQETAKGEANIAALHKERESLIQRLVEIQTQIKQSQKELQQLENQRKSSIILATSSGIIFKLNLRNSGQFLRAGESIAEVVPNNASLVTKAMIPTAEINKIAIGQKVQIRVDACPYPDYGTAKGIVKTIAPDAITSQSKDTTTNSSGIGYFEVTIQPENNSFGNNNRQCLLQAGMNATAEIISREETALQFMLRKARLTTDL